MKENRRKATNDFYNELLPAPNKLYNVQILNAQQIKEWDAYTIANEPVTFIELMERAARACVGWINNEKLNGTAFLIFCGKGNNGGDGLAIARLLHVAGEAVSVFILENGKPGSTGFDINLQRLNGLHTINLQWITGPETFPVIDTSVVVIDALFGSGLNAPAAGLTALLIQHINSSSAKTVAIDLPGGMFINKSSRGNTVIEATFTLTFQCYKKALLMQENARFTGEVKILDIGLHPGYLSQIAPTENVIDENYIRRLFKPRNRFAHKGNFGHALLVGGSYGKMGAMVMATHSCMAGGTGLTSVIVPACGYFILQSMAPVAMALPDAEEKFIAALPGDLAKYSAIGVGPGMGTERMTQNVIAYLVRRSQKQLVIDADALNCLALEPALLTQLAPHTILTPHPKEFDRLFGQHPNDFARAEKAMQKAIEYNIIIVLKSHHTLIALPDGCCSFNSTGNAGMAKGGSGDVLTGLITSLLAQGYAAKDAAILGVYLHGWAGDVAAKKYSKQAMLPTHIIECLSAVFLALETE